VTRWAHAEIHPAAITFNVARVGELVRPAQVWAVVKANGYGHGAATAARAALAGGATTLCVALIDEGLQLRGAGIDAPIMVLSEQPGVHLDSAVAAGLQLTVYSHAALAHLAATGAVDHPVHLKVDTGMHRVGCRPSDAVELALAVAASPAARLASVFTHFAVADQPSNPYTARQLDELIRTVQSVRAAGVDVPMVHAANSAAAIAHPATRLDAVRVGIAAYGLLPSDELVGHCADLQPALSFSSRVSFVKRLAAGDRISYGLRHTFAHDATVATVPVGYADGVPRRLGLCGGEVLIGGRRCPVVGQVTMDQLMVDCGDSPVEVGDAVVLIGAQGDERVTADEWAQRCGTIGYEIVCSISQRVPRIPVAS
jgi:alanine racemase